MGIEDKKRIHIPTGGRENTTLITNNPDVAQQTQKAVIRGAPEGGILNQTEGQRSKILPPLKKRQIR